MNDIHLLSLLFHNFKYNTAVFKTAVLSVLTAFSLLFILAGCSNSVQGHPGSSANISNVDDYTWLTQYIPLPRDIGELSNFMFYDGKIYFVTTKYTRPDSSNNYLSVSNASVWSMNPDGTGLTELIGCSPPSAIQADTYDDVRIHSMTIDDEGNLWLVQTWDYFKVNLPDDFDAQRDNPYDYRDSLDAGYAIRKLDITESGQSSAVRELLSVDILAILNELGIYSFPEDIAVQSTPDGERIYISSVNYSTGALAVRILNIAGNVLYRSILQSRNATLLQLTDGTVAVSDDSGVLCSVDISSGTFGESVNLPVNELLSDVAVIDYTGLKFFPGSGGFDVLTGDSKGLYGIRVEDDDFQILLDWNDSNVNADYIKNITILPDGCVVCVSSEPTASGIKNNIILLNKTLRSELPPVTELTLAGVNIGSELTDAVINFNAKNHQYHIKILDYQEPGDIYGVDDSHLAMEIITGNVPDIMVVDNIPFENYAAAGLFADLYPFIDADNGIDRSDFVQAPLNAAETDGKLYRVFSGYVISSIIGSASVLGSGTGWDLDEFEAILDANPDADIPIGDIISSSGFLRYGAIAAVINDYIDRETGTANFDSPQFIHFLKLVNRLFENTGSGGDDGYTEMPEAIRYGRQIMDRTVIFGIEYPINLIEIFGEDIVYKGYPTPSRNGHVYQSFFNSLAITEDSPNKEAAWSFVRTILDKDWQLDYKAGLLSNQNAFDQNVKDKLENPGEIMVGESRVPATSQAHIEMIVGVINSTTTVYDFDEALLNIIIEDAEDYFNGKHSAEDAARIIQSRVSIYLSERSLGDVNT